MKIYLAGPMTGIPHFNYPAFAAEAARLRAAGHYVFNPAEADTEKHGSDISNPAGCVETAARDHGFDRRAALKEDLSWICDEAEALVFLPGWQDSTGAFAERALALAIGLPVYDAGAI